MHSLEKLPLGTLGKPGDKINRFVGTETVDTDRQTD
jgi:hypothetical protein